MQIHSFFTVSGVVIADFVGCRSWGVVYAVSLLAAAPLWVSGAAVAQSLPTDEGASLTESIGSASESIRTTSYLLGVGDQLRLDVFNIPDYSGEFQVLAGGILTLPVVGPVEVEGLSLEQAAARIETELEPFVRRPRVTLSVLAVRPIQVAIAGEVHRPGAYRLVEDETDGDSTEVPTLTQVIELAGGITQLADIRQIEIQRRLAPGSGPPLQSLDAVGSDRADSALFSSLDVVSRRESTDSQIISVNLWQLLTQGDISEDLQLQDDDRIFIPTATNLTADELTELATASFSPDEIMVNVVGEVASPGSIAVPPNTPLNQAILTAGGFNSRAKRDVVTLVRLNPNGTVSEQTIEVDFTQGLADAMNPSLQPNDTVIVQRSRLATTEDTVGSALSPLSGIFGILRILGLFE